MLAQCATWVYVSAAATKTYPKRPQGAYCVRTLLIAQEMAVFFKRKSSFEGTILHHLFIFKSKFEKMWQSLDGFQEF